MRGEVVRLARQVAYLETTITDADGERRVDGDRHVHPARKETLTGRHDHADRRGRRRDHGRGDRVRGPGRRASRSRSWSRGTSSSRRPSERVEHYEARARRRAPSSAGFGPLDLTTDLAAAVAAADVVVEAVSEDLDLKRAIFDAIGAAAGDDAVLASNTSGLPIEVLGAAQGRPSQVVGAALLQPGAGDAPRRGRPRARDERRRPSARALEFCHALGKETVEVRDLPGFVTTRLGTLLMCEAIRASSRASRRPQTSTPR